MLAQVRGNNYSATSTCALFLAGSCGKKKPFGITPVRRAWGDWPGIPTPDLRRTPRYYLLYVCTVHTCQGRGRVKAMCVCVL